MKCESYPSIFENMLEIFFKYYPMLAMLGTMDLTDSETGSGRKVTFPGTEEERTEAKLPSRSS